MKVSELIGALKTYPQDATVVGLWDAFWSNIDRHSLEKDGNGNNIVVLDVETWNSYKSE